MKIDGTRSHDRATELVLAYCSALNCGDWDAMLALLCEDVVHERNQGPREVGRTAFAACLRRNAVHYREQLHDLVVLASPDGFRAAAEYTLQGEYLVDDVGLPAARGQRYSLPGGAFFGIRDGRIQRVTSYFNRQEWISQLHSGAG